MQIYEMYIGVVKCRVLCGCIGRLRDAMIANREVCDAKIGS